MSGADIVAIRQPLAELDTPALLIDADLLEKNIAAMQACMRGRDAVYRPHTKSHKSPAIARMQMAAGARGVCCAKLGEAEVMIAGGVNDVHVTTPVVGERKARRLALMAGTARVSVVVDNAENIAVLSAAATRQGTIIDVIIEMDVGQGRCGVTGAVQLVALADAVASAAGLRLKGLQGYQGKLQSIIDFGARRDAVRAALDRLMAGNAALQKRGWPGGVLTGGGTGSLTIDLALGGLNELQPGSYVFMDDSYRRIEWAAGAAVAPFANALTVLTSVVSRPLSDRAVLDVGWKAISSDSGPPALKTNMDIKAEFAGDEHSLLQGADQCAELRVGDRIELVPSHCDTTINLYDCYHVIRDGKLEAVWPVSARGRSD